MTLSAGEVWCNYLNFCLMYRTRVQNWKESIEPFKWRLIVTIFAEAWNNRIASSDKRSNTLIGDELNTLFEQAGFLDLAQPTDSSLLKQSILRGPKIIIVLEGAGTKRSKATCTDSKQWRHEPTQKNVTKHVKRSLCAEAQIPGIVPWCPNISVSEEDVASSTE